MLTALRERLTATDNGKDFIIVVLKDEQGVFHSEIYEVTNTIHSITSPTKEEVLKKSKERIQFDIAAKKITGNL